MANRTAAKIAFVVLLSAFASHASALTVTLPIVGSVSIGGGISGAGALGTTINSLLGNGTTSHSDSSVLSSVGSSLAAVVTTVVPAVAPSSGSGQSTSGISLDLAPLVTADLLGKSKPGDLPVIFAPGSIDLWKTDSNLLSISQGSKHGSEGSALLEVKAGLLGTANAVTLFDHPHDWSGYTTLGMWILPDEALHAGDIKVAIGNNAGGASTPPTFSLPLPDLTPGAWQYVRFNLSNCPPEVLRGVTRYGFIVARATAHHLRFYPPELGPGAIDHLRFVVDAAHSVGKAVAFRLEADDIFGNTLNSGAHIYNGIKHLVFSNSGGSGSSSPVVKATIDSTVAGLPLGSDVAVNFTNGLSDVISAVPLAASVNLAVNDGVTSSLPGDFSFGLDLLGGSSGSTPSDTAPSSLQSWINVSPSPAMIGTPELITVTSANILGVPLTLGGATVAATISGANPGTVTLTDIGNGTYQGVYTPVKAGIDIISAVMNGNAIGKDMDGTSDGLYSLTVVPAGTGGGGSGGGSGSANGGGGTGLGGLSNATLAKSDGTACEPYLTSFIKLGANNDPLQVRKLQVFLQDYSFGKGLAVTGVYDQPTFQAVKKFQEWYVRDVLQPWQLAQPTGYVYILTLRKINTIRCENGAASPVTAAVQQPATQAAAVDCPYFSAYAKRGATGPEVAKAQGFLKENGFLDASAPLGTYGSMTVAAIKKFQSAYASEILEPANSAATGIWGAYTMKAANRLMGCANS